MAKSLTPEQREKDRARSRAYYAENKARVLEQARAYRQANHDRIKAYDRERGPKRPSRRLTESSEARERRLARAAKRRAENPDARKAYYAANRDREIALSVARIKRLRETSLNVRLVNNLRTRLRLAIKSGQKRGSAIDLLGCSIPELITKIEALWEPGMSWDNWSRTGWHIDHKTPLTKFDLTDPAQLAAACHWSNLQPLWAPANISKGGGQRFENWQREQAA